MLKRLAALELGVTLTIEVVALAYAASTVFVWKLNDARWGDPWDKFTIRVQLIQLEVAASLIGVLIVFLLARNGLRKREARFAFGLGCLVGLLEFSIRFVNLFGLAEALRIRGNSAVLFVAVVPGLVASAGIAMAASLWSRRAYEQRVS